MRGVTLPAWSEGRYRNVPDLLAAVGPSLWQLTWGVVATEVSPHPLASRLEALTRDVRVETKELVSLFGSGLQLVDGSVHGFAGLEQRTPALVVRAVDSTSWDVESADVEILNAIKRAYADARDLPTG